MSIELILYSKSPWNRSLSLLEGSVVVLGHVCHVVCMVHGSLLPGSHPLHHLRDFLFGQFLWRFFLSENVLDHSCRYVVVSVVGSQCDNITNVFTGTSLLNHYLLSEECWFQGQGFFMCYVYRLSSSLISLPFFLLNSILNLPFITCQLQCLREPLIAILITLTQGILSTIISCISYLYRQVVIIEEFIVYEAGSLLLFLVQALF